MATPKPPTRKPAAGSRGATSPPPPSTAADLLDRKAWERFAHGVGSALFQLAKDQCLILTETRHHRFVQFMDLGPDGMRAEAVSNDYLAEGDRLSQEAIDTLHAIGWESPTHSAQMEGGEQRPTEGSPNYYMDLGPPLPIAEIAIAAAQTLIHAFGARSLGELRYRSFDTDTDEHLVFPELGIEAGKDA